VEAGGRDLHAAIEDKEGMCGLPVLAAQHVEGCRRDEVLHLAVVAAAEIKGGVVFQFKPKMRIGV